MFASLNARALGLSLSAETTVDLAALAGFGGVDLLVRDLVETGSDLRALRDRIADAGLRAGAWPLPVDWRGSADAFAHDLARLPRFAEAAATLGLTRTGTWVMPETPRRAPGAWSVAETLAFHVERLGAIARVLHQHGTRLGLEVIGVATSRTGAGGPFVHRLAELDRILGALGSDAPGLGVLVDGFHLFAAGEPLDAALAWGVGRVVWVHVADLPGSTPAEVDRASIRDRDRGLPGEHPAVRTRELLDRLARAGYDGPVTAEPMPGCRSLQGLDPETAARTVAKALQSVWPSGASAQP